MAPPMGHLGARVSALLDGQLAAGEAERAWAHVHACHACRDLVEREGWVKTRLAGLASPPPGSGPPPHLVGSLLDLPPDQRAVPEATWGSRRPPLGLVALGGGAVGAAVMGVLALGAAPADAPTLDRRTPATQLVTPTPAPAVSPSPGRRTGR